MSRLRVIDPLHYASKKPQSDLRPLALSRIAITKSMVVANTNTVDTAAIVGSTANLRLVKILMGRVMTWVPPRRKVMMNSSRERIKANSAPEIMPGKIIGRVMVDQKRGNIINISSLAGLRPYPAQPAYGAAKAGIISLTQSLAVLFAPYHIRVNAIAPATTVTPGVTQWGDSDERARKKGISLGRAGRVEDIAYAAIYLASDAADFVTSITIPVTGGPYMGRQMLEEAEADWQKSAKY